MSSTITRQQSSQLLHEIALGIENQRTIFVVGGGVCAMHYCRAIRSTNDLDVKLVEFPVRLLYSVVDRLRIQHNLCPRWFDNDWHYKYDLPGKYSAYANQLSVDGSLTVRWLEPTYLACLYLHSLSDRKSIHNINMLMLLVLEQEIDLRELREVYSSLYPVGGMCGEFIFDMVTMFRNQVNLEGYELAVAYNCFVQSLPITQWTRQVKQTIRFIPTTDFYEEVEEVCEKYDYEDSVYKKV